MFPRLLNIREYSQLFEFEFAGVVAQKRTKKALLWGNAFFSTHSLQIARKSCSQCSHYVVTTNVKKLEAIRGRQ